MADMTRFDLDKVNVIGKLGTTPQERGLTTQQFKDKFDEGPIALGEFVNETLIPEVEAHLAENVTDVDGVHGLKVERGTWTPEVVGTLGGTAVLNKATVGTYERIGNLVYVQFFIALTSKNDMSGSVRIQGLPFLIYGSTVNDKPYCVLGLSNVALSTNYIKLANSAPRSTARIDLYMQKNDGTYHSLAVANISDNFQIEGSMIYRIA